jgi:soluble lytic murein transglycosylase-like protein
MRWVPVVAIALAACLRAQTPAPANKAAGAAAPVAATAAASGGSAPKAADAAESASAKKPAAAAETFQTSLAKQKASIEAQRTALGLQRGTAASSGWMLGPPRVNAALAGDDVLPPPPPECDPMADSELAPLIGTAAQQHKLDPKLIRGVIEQESSGRACAVSAKGAMGLMQLMPATAEQFKLEDAFDAKANIEAGASYLRQLLDKYKDDIKLALAAYNAGPTAVDKTGAIPDIKETQDYVESVLAKMK